MTARDVDLIQHRIDAITRSATRIRQHLADLHWIAHEKPAVVHEVNVDDDQRGKIDWSPRGGDPRALRLWEHLTRDLERIESAMVGFERSVIGYFMVNSTSADPSRGSLIPASDHDRLLANQRERRARGDYTPARLIDQPPHPGKGR